LSGWVNEAVFWWDDGTEKNAYVGTNNLEQSRFRFTGEAKIDKDWSAGYTLEIGVWGEDSSRFDQNGPADTAAANNHNNGMQVRKSNWWIKNKDLGKVTVGLEGTATYHVLDDADGANTRNVYDAEADGVYQGAFFIRSNKINTGIRWNQALRGFNNATPGQDGRRNIVRYDSPTWEGLSFATAWGEDDLWDAAITFKKDIHDFAVVAKAGYGESTDPAATNCGGPTPNFECKWAGAAATIMHKPTGLYVYGGYGWQKINSLVPIGALQPDETSTTWFIQPGIEHKWHPLGKTTIFGEYRHDEAGANVSAPAGGGLPGGFTTRGAEATFWAGGVVQNIEAAAMDLYVVYRHADGNLTLGSAVAGLGAAGTTVGIDDFDMVIGGAMIKF